MLRSLLWWVMPGTHRCFSECILAVNLLHHFLKKFFILFLCGLAWITPAVHADYPAFVVWTPHPTPPEAGNCILAPYPSVPDSWIGYFDPRRYLSPTAPHCENNAILGRLFLGVSCSYHGQEIPNLGLRCLVSYSCGPDALGYRWNGNGYDCVTASYKIKLSSQNGFQEANAVVASVEPSKTSNLVAYVYDQNGRSVSGAKVKLEVDVVPNSGGHQHDDDRRHTEYMGKLASGSGTTAQNGKVLTGTTDASGIAFAFTAPLLAGDHKIKASCTDGKNCKLEGPDTVWVGIKDLVPLGVSQYFVPIGDTPNHFDNHYLTLEAASRVNVLAALYRAKFPTNPLLHLNDASLERGGVFDVSSNWQSPHFEHCKGTTIDVRANDALGAIPPQNQPVFEDLAQKVGAEAIFEIPEDRNGNQLYHLRHYHVQLMGSEGLTCK